MFYVWGAVVEKDDLFDGGAHVLAEASTPLARLGVAGPASEGRA